MLRHALSPLFEPKSIILLSRYPLPLTASLPDRLRGATTEAVFSASGGMSLPPLNGVAPGERPDLAIVWVAPDELEQALRLLSGCGSPRGHHPWPHPRATSGQRLSKVG